VEEGCPLKGHSAIRARGVNSYKKKELSQREQRSIRSFQEGGIAQLARKGIGVKLLKGTRGAVANWPQKARRCRTAWGEAELEQTVKRGKSCFRCPSSDIGNPPERLICEKGGGAPSWSKRKMDATKQRTGKAFVERALLASDLTQSRACAGTKPCQPVATFARGGGKRARSLKN